MENTAQFTALTRISLSPGVPNLPIEADARSPFETTSRTPAKARKMPKVFIQFILFFRMIHPNNAMNTGAVETIHAVVPASESAVHLTEATDGR